MKFLSFGVPLVLLSSLITSPILSHFFSVDKWNNAVYLVSDYHESTQEENKVASEQQTQLLDLATQIDATIVVEDGVMINNGDALSTSAELKTDTLDGDTLKIYSANLQTPLHTLYSQAVHHDVSAVNVEFRYSKFRPLNNFFELIEAKKRRIRSWNDGEPFNRFYVAQLAMIEEMFEQPCAALFDTLRTQNVTLEQFLAQNPDLIVTEQMKELFNAIITDHKLEHFNWSESDMIEMIFNDYTCLFLDFEIMHAIAQSHGKPVIIAAGDHHIQCVKRSLEKIGFSSIKKSGNELEVLAGGYKEPQAVNITQAFNDVGAEKISFVAQLIALCGVFTTITQ